MSKNKFLKTFDTLQQQAVHFEAESILAKKQLLTALNAQDLPNGQQLLKYHELLLFFCAYPDDAVTHRLAEKELTRIATLGKKLKTTKNALPENEGLPFAHTVTRFSPDFLTWLQHHDDINVVFDSFYNPSLSLNNILSITLPAVLKAETTAGLNNEQLLEVLHIKPGQYIPFLLGQLEELNDRPLLKELFIERMDLYVKLIPKNRHFSRAYNRLPVKQIFYQPDLLKNFDYNQLINSLLPGMRTPDRTEKQLLYKVIRNAMALTVREIDPATFLQIHTMRVCQLERGLSIAIYSMLPQRQLPLETYFGFTFFKNGIPISYGGIWVFGQMAKLGLNIFEPYRLGESGFILCQLIRVCKQVLGTSYFEIEPYQFGLDNPGGIRSGAFWFYYKYGFKPVDQSLKQLAEKEYHKIKTRKKYRSTSDTLLKFTESNIALNLNKTLPLDVLDLMNTILTVIKKSWQHNYGLARQQAVNNFCKKLKIDTAKLNITEKNILEEISLWAMAMQISKPKKLQLMKQMVFTKTKDDYAYQQLLLYFFES